MGKFKLLLAGLLAISFQVFAQFSNEFQVFNSTNTPVFSGNNFKCIWVGKGNQIWAGTQYQGLYRYDTARKAWTKSAQLTNVFINQIQTDRNGGIWIAQSGTSGTVGGGSNTAGGVNYFPDTTDAGMQFYSTGSLLSSRNVRSLYLDTFSQTNYGMRRVWTAQATFITSNATAAGGITKWQDSLSGNFQRVYGGLQVFPYVVMASSGTPSCYTVCGDDKEVWVGAETNFVSASGSTSQILRYDAVSGYYLGGYDQNGAFDNTRMFYKDQARVYKDSSTRGIIPASFRTTAMHVDGEKRRWIGLRSGGVLVKVGATWNLLNMPTIFPAGTTINFNAITSDEYGYVYIGTTNGLVVYDNGGELTDTIFYKRLTTADGLPSNNITGVAYDKAGGRVVLTTDAGVVFWKVNYKINVQMVWDYSFPDRTAQPIGVAADGISRIYLKIRKASDTLPDIQSVKISLKDFSSGRANERGKLKKALVIDRYSEEASSGTASEVVINYGDLRPADLKTYWCWYLAPQDFCSDTTSSFAPLRRRYDTLQIIATYTNNQKDTIDYKIGVVRPPTLFVHGLASSPAAWDLLKHNHYGQYVQFINSPVLTYKRALKMDPIGYFHKNGMQLLGGDASAYSGNEDRLNTLQGTIEAMRKMRYASNQVDYVCHSMGGIMIRSAIGFFPNKFYSGANDMSAFKNYDSGYTHKIITINTPHNGAPIADVLDQFIPETPTILLPYLNFAYSLAPELIGGFFKPVGSTWNYGGFKATDAVNNLQVTEARGGVRMLHARAKNHMICGDLNWYRYIELIKKQDYYLGKIYKVLLQVMYASTYDSDTFDPVTASDTRNMLRQLIDQAPEYMIAGFLNWMAEKRGYHNYLADSDAIVPLMSQTAQQSASSLHVTVFNSTDTANGAQGMNANHSAILWREDVGQRVFQLLNTRTSSFLFSNDIPEDTDPEPPVLLRSQPQARLATTPQIRMFRDTTKIRIDNPAGLSALSAGDAVTIRFRVKDTSRLAYLLIRFQGEDSFRVRRTLGQQSVQFTVQPNIADTTSVTALAVYDNAAGNGIDYYQDSLAVVVNQPLGLQGFRIAEETASLISGESFFPSYEVNYNGNWLKLPASSAGLQVVVDSVAVASYSGTSLGILASGAGRAVATASYKGFSDSVLLEVVLPYTAFCVNQTIASGNFSNPAIWSKGMVPGPCDSIIIRSGHNLLVDTTLMVRAIRIDAGGILRCSAGDSLIAGEPDQALSMVDVAGTLQVESGALRINGALRFASFASFLMTGGRLVIDGNTGVRETSAGAGTYLFDAPAGMNAFNFSGGILQLVDPPKQPAGQAMRCVYDFGPNSVLQLGDGQSLTAGNNPDGFGGLNFPAKIGRLVIQTGTRNGNRMFVNKKALNVKGSVEIKTGSGLLIQAPITVNQ